MPQSWGYAATHLPGLIKLGDDGLRSEHDPPAGSRSGALSVNEQMLSTCKYSRLWYAFGRLRHMAPLVAHQVRWEGGQDVELSRPTVRCSGPVLLVLDGVAEAQLALWEGVHAASLRPHLVGYHKDKDEDRGLDVTVAAVMSDLWDLRALRDLPACFFFFYFPPSFCDAQCQRGGLCHRARPAHGQGPGGGSAGAGSGRCHAGSHAQGSPTETVRVSDLDQPMVQQPIYWK